MRVAVIGAAGQVGRLTARAACAAGHTTIAIARNPETIPDDPGPGRLLRFTGDILKPESLHSALRDVNAVVTTFGAPLTLDTILHTPDLCERGTKNLLEAMQAHRITRLICMTAIGVGDSRGHGRWVFRNLVQPALLQRIFTDRERQEALVRASQTQWTIVRPAELTDGPATPVRTIESFLPGDPEPSTVSRASVAQFIITELINNAFVGRSPVITN